MTSDWRQMSKVKISTSMIPSISFQSGEYFGKLKMLVEESFQKDDRKVVLVWGSAFLFM